MGINLHELFRKYQTKQSYKSVIVYYYTCPLHLIVIFLSVIIQYTSPFYTFLSYPSCDRYFLSLPLSIMLQVIFQGFLMNKSIANLYIYLSIFFNKAYVYNYILFGYLPLDEINDSERDNFTN